MSVGLYNTDREVVQTLLFRDVALPDAVSSGLARVLASTTSFKLGVHAGDVVYILGLITPCIMSDCAYLWMHVVDKSPQGSVVVLMRRSRETIQALLEIYPTIVGHATEDSLRWLRWLGAKLDAPMADGLIPFNFRRYNG